MDRKNKIKEKKEDQIVTVRQGWWSRFLKRLAEANKDYPRSTCRT